MKEKTKIKLEIFFSLVILFCGIYLFLLLFKLSGIPLLAPTAGMIKLKGN